MKRKKCRKKKKFKVKVIVKVPFYRNEKVNSRYSDCVEIVNGNGSVAGG